MVTVVVLSVSSKPLSLAGIKSGAAGVAGAMMSTVTARAAPTGLLWPRPSVCTARMLWVPAANAKSPA